MKSVSTALRDDTHSTAPTETMYLIGIVAVIGVIVGVAVLAPTAEFGEPTTVSGGSGDCLYSHDFDPRDVVGFAEDRAANQRYTDGSFGCVLWLDASQSRGFAPGVPVRTWTDKSSNRFSVTPIGDAPEWAIVDGVQAVGFDGNPNSSFVVDTTPDAMGISADSGVTVTMLVYVSDKASQGGLYTIGEAGGTEGTAFELRQSDEAGNVDRSDEWWATPGPTPKITTEAEWAIITHTTDGKTGTLFVNGDSQGTGTNEVATLGTDIQIGSAGSDRVFNGYVAEYFVSNRQLSKTQRNMVQCAMTANHDYVVNLDVC